MKVAACQLEIVWENKEANFAKVESMVAEAALPAGSLLILPEMFATGFSFNLALTAETPGSVTDSFLANLAKKHNIHVLAGMIALQDSKALNQVVLFSKEGRSVARYSKLFPFSGAGEQVHHAAGNEISLVSCEGFSTALFICYDLRFPEIFRRAARRGAELLVVVANWPVARIQHWITLLQARAIENQAYVVGVNCVGKDPKFDYSGRSIVVNPHGEIIADAGSEERIVTADLDVGMVRDWRRDFPALRDLRPEFLAADVRENSLA